MSGYDVPAFRFLADLGEVFVYAVLPDKLLVRTAFSDDGVVALRERHDKVMTAGFFRCGDHFRFGCVRFSEADIGADRIVEQVDILEYHRNICQQAVTRKFAQIVSADCDTARLRIIKACDQAADRCLSGTGCPCRLHR